MPKTEEYEKLGAFFLGRRYNLESKKGEKELILYDSRDLLTHAVCVGMTGSGKTGLCISLLEEAAIDGVPVIAIDPKGDLGNLMLTFPGLSAAEFEPWVSDADARRQGIEVHEFAERQANLWKNGLAEWGEDGDRIRRLKEAADFAIYTPGSNAGLPLSILKSFAVPPATVLEDTELMGERTDTTVTSLLGLAGIEADPIRSREHILLARIINESWNEGRDLDLASLIQAIQQPPFDKVGVMDLESFYPGKDRFQLAMSLNNLLAAPGFGAWMEGEPMDIANLFYSPSGKPRASIISIAHLNDAERMFIVSLLLNQLLGWVRQQSGTTSLRAILYMDEIFGYFSPVANPPSKQPLLTLLKQARAFGLGIVLATQNPVDLDYKGLSNTGTWFLGRLQTERDKARVLDGLEGASAGAGSRFDRQAMEETLAGLGNRIFVMNNVHEDKPVVFETRWAMSYLCGPLTRTQIKRLMDPVRAALKPAAAPVASASATSSGGQTQPPVPAALGGPVRAGNRPLVPAEVTQYFVPVRSSQPAGHELVYRPMAIGACEIHFADTKTGVDASQQVAFFAEITEDPIPVDWETAVETDIDPNDLEKAPREGASFLDLPQAAARARSYATWGKALADFVYRSRTIDLLKSNYYGRFSKAGESERDFRIRLQQLVREERDAEVERLRQKYSPKITVLEDRIRRAEQAIAREEAEAGGAKMDTMLSIGSTVLGALFGRKTLSASNIGRAASSVRSAGRAVRQSQDIGRAQETLESYKEQLHDVHVEFDAEIEALKSRNDPATEPFDLVQIKPKKKDISVKLIALAWTPGWRSSSGEVKNA